LGYAKWLARKPWVAALSSVVWLTILGTIAQHGAPCLCEHLEQNKDWVLLRPLDTEFTIFLHGKSDLSRHTTAAEVCIRDIELNLPILYLSKRLDSNMHTLVRLHAEAQQ
jgi:hypothetical protein